MDQILKIYSAAFHSYPLPLTGLDLCSGVMPDENANLWAWTIKSVLVWLSSIEASSDICVSLPCDLFRGFNAGLFSSPIVWELFNIPPYSVGTETLPSSSLFK